MHDLFGFLNSAGDQVLDLARPMFLQSSLLILLLLAGDRLLRHRIRPILRHSLWLLVPIKLLLPPTLALPTSPSYWLPGLQIHAAPPPTSTLAASFPGFPIRHFENNTETEASTGAATAPVQINRPEAMPTRSGLLLAVWILGTLVLFGRIAVRTGSLRKLKIQATLAPEPLHRETDTIRAQIGLRRTVPLLLHDGIQTPALCGLSDPVMLLPRNLLRTLTPPQLRSVLLHEFIHARRGDLWINAAQTFLQMIWWWHPLLWLANSRLRTTREEAVDDEVAHHLGPEAGDYPLALLEVARHAIRRPVLSLGLIGIIGTRSALRSRIERLLERPAHGSPRMGISAILTVLVTGLVLLPMARGGASKAPIQTETTPSEEVVGKNQSDDPDTINPAARSPETEGTTRDRLRSDLEHARIYRTALDLRLGTNAPKAQAQQQRVAALESRIAQLGRPPSPPKPPPPTADPVNWYTDVHTASAPPSSSGTNWVLQSDLWELDRFGKSSLTTGRDTVFVESESSAERTTHMFRFDGPSLIARLETELGRELGDEPSSWTQAFAEALDRAGFTPSAPNVFFIQFPQGFGMVSGKPDQVAAAQRFLDPPARSILVEAFAFLLPIDEAKTFGLGRAIGLPPNSRPSTNRFSATELRGFLSALKNRPDVEAIARPRIITLPGRGAEIAFTNSPASSAATLSFRVQPELAADGQGLQLDCRASVTQFLSLTSDPRNQLIANPSEAASDSTPFTVHALGYVTQHLTNTVRISDGEGFLMTTPSPGAGPLSVRRPIIYVKATWMNPGVDRQ
jgi:beta-lactamase regulating signal transducer with metallopeptidase domain